MILTREEAQALTQRVLGMSHADECRVSLLSGLQANTRFADNGISTSGDSNNDALVVRSTFGHRIGNASTNILTDEGLRRVVDMSERIARLSPEDREFVSELGPQQYTDVPAFFDRTANLDPAGRADAVNVCIEAARRADCTTAGFLTLAAGANAVANSKGLFAYHRATTYAMTETVRTTDGTGSGWAGTAGNDWSRARPGDLAETAARKAQQSQNPVAVEPGRYTVVLEPTAVANLLQLLNFAMQARAADEGRSFFSKRGGGNRIGDKIVDERVTITSNPWDPELLAAPFGPDGLPNKAMTWIENGVVRNLIYDRYWASQKNVEPTGFPAGIRMAGGTGSIDDLVRSTERGILVTRFWYIRPLDPRTILYTGLTRDGTFLIENGRISHPVKNFRFNESPIVMLSNLEAMGRPIRVSASESGDIGAAVVVPPIKTRDFNFQSVSDAV
ncbi:MAG: TldD/PmbA family protein [Gemmatimonadales bacterium]